MGLDASPSISASPTLLLVTDVEETIRFLQKGFDLRLTGSWGQDAGAMGFGMLENPSGSVRVVVGPRMAGLDGLEPQGCASLTLSADRVRDVALAAVKAGARLVSFHRTPLQTNQGSLHAPAAASTEVSAATDQYPDQSANQSADQSAEQCADQSENGLKDQPTDQSQDQPTEGGDDAGLAWLEGPSGLLRVILIDKRLLSIGSNASGISGNSSLSGSRDCGRGDGDSDSNGRAAPADSKNANIIRVNDNKSADSITQYGRTHQYQSKLENIARAGGGRGAAFIPHGRQPGPIEGEGSGGVGVATGAAATRDGSDGSMRGSEASGGTDLQPPPLLLVGLASWAKASGRRNVSSSSPSSPTFFAAFSSPTSSLASASSSRSFYSASSTEKEGLHLRPKDVERSKASLPQTNGGGGGAGLAQRSGGGSGGDSGVDTGGGGSIGGTVGGTINIRDGYGCGGVAEGEHREEGGAIGDRDGSTHGEVFEQGLRREGIIVNTAETLPPPSLPAPAEAAAEAAVAATTESTAATTAAPEARAGVAEATAPAARSAATEAIETTVAASTEARAETVAGAATGATAGTGATTAVAVTSVAAAVAAATEAATNREAVADTAEDLNGSETTAPERRPGERQTGEVFTQSGVADDGAGGGRRSRIKERPCRELELFQLGNLDGPLKIVPNSPAPIPINNRYFEGSALLMVKRNPMATRYAHMFEGKNRMFEIQVQGRFKMPPDGDLYITLEITDRMKLGLLTKGLCKLLLSFCQRMTSGLHYSFGDKDNKELPHISFPLVASVDSLICTAEGDEVPMLGKPFQESKESKDKRKRGQGDTAGFGTFLTGCTYSFSFHSMYLDMPNWSTCKVPVMRDMDLHTFWGSSALRIAAYVIKPSSVAAGGVATAASSYAGLHLQSELDYVFCIQVRHRTKEEQANASPAEHPEEYEEEEEEAEAVVGGGEEKGEGEEEGLGVGDEITLPLLTDCEPSPRARQLSTSRWMSNDDASDGEMEQRQARRRRRRQEDATREGAIRSVPGRSTALSSSSFRDDRDPNSEDDDDDDDGDDDDDAEDSDGGDNEDSSDASFRTGERYANKDNNNDNSANNKANTNNSYNVNNDHTVSEDSDYRPLRWSGRAGGVRGNAAAEGSVVSAGAGGAVGAVEAGAAGEAARPEGPVGGGGAGLGEGGVAGVENPEPRSSGGGRNGIGDNTRVSPPSLRRRNSGMAAWSSSRVRDADGR